MREPARLGGSPAREVLLTLSRTLMLPAAEYFPEVAVENVPLGPLERGLGVS
jgi:hypothetical protein